MDSRPRDRYGRPLPPGSRDELARDGLVDRRVDAPARLLAEGIARFDAARFFEAHEWFEAVWKSRHVAASDRRFWKGVTQLAVACCHAQRGNARGALALLERAIDHLRAPCEDRRGVDGEALVALARELGRAIERHGASAALSFPRFPG